jgi:hypothetical protein
MSWPAFALLAMALGCLSRPWRPGAGGILGIGLGRFFLIFGALPISGIASAFARIGCKCRLAPPARPAALDLGTGARPCRPRHSVLGIVAVTDLREPKHHRDEAG